MATAQAAKLRWADLADSSDSDAESECERREQQRALIKSWADLSANSDACEDAGSGKDRPNGHHAQPLPPPSPGSSTGALCGDHARHRPPQPGSSLPPYEGSVNSNERDWERRQQHRASAVAKIYQEQLGRLFVETVRSLVGDEGGQGTPLSPNPSDRGLSKRQWEFLVLVWKDNMRLYIKRNHKGPLTEEELKAIQPGASRHRPSASHRSLDGQCRPSACHRTLNGQRNGGQLQWQAGW